MTHKVEEMPLPPRRIKELMEFKITSGDELKVLSSTKWIVENPEHVFINPDNIKKTSEVIGEQLEKNSKKVEVDFGVLGNFEMDMQLIFIEDVVNFCFWEESGKPKWQVVLSKKHIPTGGWFSLVNCFKRAINNKIPILDAEYLSELKIDEARKIFVGQNQVSIPLLKERVENLNEAGRVLLENFNGEFVNLYKKSGNDAIKLVELLIDNFTSFGDIANLNGKQIYFLKRAQIAVNDISYLLLEEGESMKNLDKLTAFSDYKLPQMLRHYQVIKYSDKLTKIVDNYQLIPSGAREEIEIRASTIWSIELIRQYLGKYSSGEIDNALWAISQDQSKVERPYHRTYTIFY